MAGYAKLFSDIVDSSIWDESPSTCKVWVTLLALSDQDGYVRGSSGWLAGKAKVTLEECELALAKFEAPDPRSRTPDNDGRRIEKLPDGWLILNYIIFRERLSTNAKASATRERVRRHRENQKKRYVTPAVLPSVTLDDSASASASVQVKGGVGGKGESPVTIPPKLNNPAFIAAWAEWVPWRKKKSSCKDFPTLFKKQLEWLSENAEDAAAIINASLRNDWQGLFPLKDKNEPHRKNGVPRDDRNAHTLNAGRSYAGAAKKSQENAKLPGL